MHRTPCAKRRAACRGEVFQTGTRVSLRHVTTWTSVSFHPDGVVFRLGTRAGCHGVDLSTISCACRLACRLLTVPCAGDARIGERVRDGESHTHREGEDATHGEDARTC